jgi:hypothetical protein
MGYFVRGFVWESRRGASPATASLCVSRDTGVLFHLGTADSIRKPMAHCAKFSKPGCHPLAFVYFEPGGRGILPRGLFVGTPEAHK